MKIFIGSISEHRIDVRMAKYMTTALESTYEIVDAEEADLLLIINGFLDDKYLVELSKTKPVLYFVDDHTLPILPGSVVVSQFFNDGDIRFLLSELMFFDVRFDKKVVADRIHKLAYWGHEKPERKAYYKKYLANKHSSLLIGEWDKDRATVIPYTRDLDEMYDLLQAGTFTYVFGDEYHNGRNYPWRIHEALMCGLVPYVDYDLVRGQRVGFPWQLIVKSPNHKRVRYDEAYKLMVGDIKVKRQEVADKLVKVIEEVKDRANEKVYNGRY